MTTLHISLLVATMAFASVDVEACSRPKKQPLKGCNEWCSSLANCATGFGKKPNEQNCWFAKTSSDPAEDLLNGIAENNVYTNIETVLELDLVGRPTMQHSNGWSVDGTYDSEGEVDSCSPIQLRKNTYWGVNLGGRYKITEVKFPGWFQSGYLMMGQMNYFRVLVSDVELSANTTKDIRSPDFKTCRSYKWIENEQALSADCDPLEGSFVYIQFPLMLWDVRYCNLRVFVSGSCCERQVPESTECPTKVNYC